MKYYKLDEITWYRYNGKKWFEQTKSLSGFEQCELTRKPDMTGVRFCTEKEFREPFKIVEDEM
jgi:hypothetical protein